jgi:hypothetical protein
MTKVLTQLTLCLKSLNSAGATVATGNKTNLDNLVRVLQNKLNTMKEQNNDEDEDQEPKAANQVNKYENIFCNNNDQNSSAIESSNRVEKIKQRKFTS